MAAEDYTKVILTALGKSGDIEIPMRRLPGGGFSLIVLPGADGRDIQRGKIQGFAALRALGFWKDIHARPEPARQGLTVLGHAGGDRRAPAGLVVVFDGERA